MHDLHISRPASVRAAFVLGLAPLALGLLAGCTTLPPWLAADGPITVTAANPRADQAALTKLHVAVQASQPGQGRLTQSRLAEARRALESLLTDDSAEARSYHPYARALLEQIRERQRLSAQNERLNRELDAGGRNVEEQGRELDTLRRQNAELQKKLDALTEIERRLPPPVTPAAPRPGGSG